MASCGESGEAHTTGAFIWHLLMITRNMGNTDPAYLPRTVYTVSVPAVMCAAAWTSTKEVTGGWKPCPSSSTRTPSPISLLSAKYITTDELILPYPDGVMICSAKPVLSTLSITDGWLYIWEHLEAILPNYSGSTDGVGEGGGWP